MPDPIALYAVMGAAAGNMLVGSPVWLMLVGPPGCGKTEMLESLSGVGKVVLADSVKNEASFLSGTRKKDRAKDATGGLLEQIGQYGAIVVADFTEIMSLPLDALREVLGALTRVYDGRWSRAIGGEGGKQLKWEGKLAMFGGVTGAKIDEHHQLAAALGQRWVFFRMPENEEGLGFAQLKRALENGAKREWKEELRAAVGAFFGGLDLEFGQGAERRELLARETLRIARIAAVAVRCRSGVTRDWRSKDIVSAPEGEFESRLGQELGQLYIGMDYIGVPERDRWRVVEKVALDSMPRLRRMILQCVSSNGAEGRSMAEIMSCIWVEEAREAGRSAVDRAVMDLAIHGIVRKKKVKTAAGWEARVTLTEWMEREFSKGFGSL